MCLSGLISMKLLLTIAHNNFTELGDGICLSSRLSDITSINEVPLDCSHIDKQKIVGRALTLKNAKLFVAGLRVSKQHSEWIVCW